MITTSRQVLDDVNNVHRMPNIDIDQIGDFWWNLPFPRRDLPRWGMNLF